MGSEALELALAVYRTPIKRHALYDMALPQDIGLVLQLASAPQPLLSEVAAEVGENEDTVVEASRFYLQLALFQPDADAYRVLGLAVGAAHERIREHYRWLQRWLHPDRRGEDWEALFATRVNWAWSNLRNDAVRRAYDIEYDQDASTHADDSAALEVSRGAEWNLHHTYASRTHRLSKVVIGALLCCCAALLYVALTRGDGPPPDEIGARPISSAVKDRGSVTRSHLPPSSPSSVSLRGEQLASVPNRTGIVHEGEGVQRGEEEPVLLADSHEIDVALAAALKAAAAEGVSPASKPALREIADAAAVPVSSSDRGSGQESEKSAAAMRRATLADESDTDADAPSKNALDDDKRGAPVESRTARHLADAGSLADLVTTQRSPAAAPSDPNNAAALNERNAAVTDDALARIDLAHQRVKEMSVFFSKFDSRLPPIWNDVAGQTSAEAQRSALYERAGQRDPADFVVDDPRWRMSQDSAALTANYHVLKHKLVAESGHLSLNMVWREKMWLVTQIELRPAQ